MKQTLHQDNRGVAHLALIVIGVVVLAVIGFAAWRVMSNKDGNPVSNAIDQQVAQVECNKNLNDKDLCKFFTSWETNKKYRMKTSSPEGTSTFEIDGENTHTTMSFEGKPYETIVIGNTTYTKGGETWWKQTAETTKNDTPEEDVKVDFDEPETNEEVTSMYKKLGEEACGNLTCFKYQLINKEASASDKTYFWFDTKEFKIRRYQFVTSKGTTDVTYEYDNVKVEAPTTNVKELGKNQYLVPGQADPVTLPGGPVPPADL